MNNKQPVYKVVYEESIINNNVIPTYTIYVKLEVNNNNFLFLPALTV